MTSASGGSTFQTPAGAAEDHRLLAGILILIVEGILPLIPGVGGR